jgi:exopolyphosphatase/guanosine-5'-triphosphate,3'-diphosphate pyrophosphatase
LIGQCIGIIDIGSGSVRLVVYEKTDNGGHRVVDGSKRSTRLSGRMDESGALPLGDIAELIDTLQHFKLICSHHGITQIRTVATAAIRNAANRDQILDEIHRETGLFIELLSGEDEAAYGFLGMINSLQADNGYLIDIGGGSTEVSLFMDRELVHSVSFPFGCVSLNKKFDSKDGLTDDALKSIESIVMSAVKENLWIGELPGLPLVGVGGTVRALGKVHQAAVDYPFRQTHNYIIEKNGVDELYHAMRAMPLDRRRKLPGLSKDRADVIIPGVAILRAVFRAARARHYRICGAGLRDGLFHSTRFPDQPKLADPLAFSLKNISSLHTEAPTQHVMQVNRLALNLLETLETTIELPPEARTILHVASLLHRIGASIDYYDYAPHSFYLIVHSQLNGLTHREIVMTAAIASFRGKGKARTQTAPYRVLVSEADLDLVGKLGLLLQLAAALDRSETQRIGDLLITIDGTRLLLAPLAPLGSLAVERREVGELAAEFRKHWLLEPVLEG